MESLPRNTSKRYRRYGYILFGISLLLGGIAAAGMDGGMNAAVLLAAGGGALLISAGICLTAARELDALESYCSELQDLIWHDSDSDDDSINVASGRVS